MMTFRVVHKPFNNDVRCRIGLSNRAQDVKSAG